MNTLKLKTEFLNNHLRKTFVPDSEICLGLLALEANNALDANAIKIYKKLANDGPQWVNDLSLYEAGLRILTIYRYDPYFLEASVLALFAKRLIDVELKVGGPYTEDLKTNAIISQLFHTLGKPLKGVDEFIIKKSRTEINFLKKLENAWSVSWPNEIIKIPEDIIFPVSDTPQSIAFSACLMSLHNESSLQISELNFNSQLQEIAEKTSKIIDEFAPPIRSHAKMALKTIERADPKHEIALLSSYFKDSLKNSLRKKSRLNPTDLGLANQFGWIAYGIYDDIVDNEIDTAYLSLANIAHRIALQTYRSVCNPAQMEVIYTTYNALDEANLWELTNARSQISNNRIEIISLPLYSNGRMIAERAMGHVAGALLITAEVVNITSIEFGDIRKGFYHFLIARQLNDDAHDWMKDLKRGHLNYGLVLLLLELNVKPGSYDLDLLIKKVKRYFFKSGLKFLSELTLKHISSSRSYFLKSNLIDLTNPFLDNVINPIQKAAETGLHENSEQKYFLDTIKKVL